MKGGTLSLDMRVIELLQCQSAALLILLLFLQILCLLICECVVKSQLSQLPLQLLVQLDLFQIVPLDILVCFQKFVIGCSLFLLFVKVFEHLIHLLLLILNLLQIVISVPLLSQGGNDVPDLVVFLLYFGVQLLAPSLSITLV